MIQGLPKGVRREAMKAFADEIQNHPMLANRRIVCNWKLFDENSSSATNVDPTPDMMPCVRMRMIGGSVERLASQGPSNNVATILTQSKPMVAIELWTKGLDQGDNQDIADLIESALFPSDQNCRTAILERFRSVGIMDHELVQEIAPQDLTAFGSGWIAAIGLYRLTLVFSS